VTVGKVFWHCTISLDGFIAAPDGSVNWLSAGPAAANPLGWAAVPTMRRSADAGRPGCAVMIACRRG
jgi:hypothetical protein